MCACRFSFFGLAVRLLFVAARTDPFAPRVWEPLRRVVLGAAPSVFRTL
jgi:hypothetical protein